MVEESLLKGTVALMPGTLLALITVPQLMAFYKSLGDAGPAIVLAFTGAFTWLFQRYAGYLADQWKAGSSGYRYAAGMLAEIQSLLDSYSSEFTAAARALRKKQVADMYVKPKTKAKPLVLVSSASDPVYDQLEGKLLHLPLGITGPVIAFFISDGLFDASYQKLASQDFVDASKDRKLQLVDAVFADCKTTCDKARTAITAIQDYQRNFVFWRAALLGSHAMVAIILLNNIYKLVAGSQ